MSMQGKYSQTLKCNIPNANKDFKIITKFHEKLMNKSLNNDFIEWTDKYLDKQFKPRKIKLENLNEKRRK